MTFTVVAFHAHPDDEALLTAGTLARAVAQGHRVVLVVATDGAAGLCATTPQGPALARVRATELELAAGALGITDVRDLGYGDSGSDGRASSERPAFAHADVGTATLKLSSILHEVNADVLISYDEAGGYGHPDHRQVHRVGAAAARLAGTPVVLEATVDRVRLRRALRLIRWMPGLPAGFRPRDVDNQYCPPEQITHRIDVTAELDRKRAAMRAHRSQALRGADARTLGVCLRLPRWLYARVFRYEWYREPGRCGTQAPVDDIFASLREGSALGADVSTRDGAGPGCDRDERPATRPDATRAAPGSSGRSGSSSPVG